MNTPFRPLFHFSPPSGWMNDPNGLVFQGGWWHLFFQLNSSALQLGAMSWGHARSRDLFVWEHLPIALAPDELGDIWSGSAAIWSDEQLVAAFTHHLETRQAQSLALSGDEGRTWQKFAENPVLTSESRDFRDPKIFRWDNSWRMIVAAGSELQFLSSPDLKSWSFDSNFPAPHEGWVWECPDLFELEGRHVLLASFIVPDASPETHYWLGAFDGNLFSPASGPHRLGFGPDDYAAISWNNAPDNRRVLIGWMSNWNYAGQTPTEAEGWRGAMTLPRELSLRAGQLVQNPARELEAFRGTPVPFDGQAASLDERAFELEVELEIEHNGRAFFTFSKEGVAVATVGYDEEFSQDEEWQTISLWRDLPFDAPKEFQFFLALNAQPRRVHLRIFVDACSVELFAQGGEVYGAALVFPPEGAWEIECLMQRARVVSGTMWPLERD